jgi:hypothetical protein
MRNKFLRKNRKYNCERARCIGKRFLGKFFFAQVDFFCIEEGAKFMKKEIRLLLGIEIIIRVC